MATESKEDYILRLILENSPTKHWHFEQILKDAKVTRAVANKWLKRYCESRLLKKVKEKGRFPYFTSGPDNQVYQSRKRIYALEQLYSSGLVEHLSSLDKAKAVIIFGSIARGDWYKGSDVDIFIYGDPSGFDKHKFERILKRDIELHVFETEKDFRNVRTGLINNIINGYIIKGQIQDFASVS